MLRYMHNALKFFFSRCVELVQNLTHFKKECVNACFSSKAMPECLNINVFGRKGGFF